MKQAILFLCCWLLTIGAAYSQINWGEYSQSFPDRAMDQHSTVALILAIPKENNSFWLTNENSLYFNELSKDNAFLAIRPNDIISRTTFDEKPAHFFLHGVNSKNAHLYQYRVTAYPENKVVVPWMAVNRFTDSVLIKISGLPRMAYLGGYKAKLDHLLIMDVRNIETNQIVATALIAWESIRPLISNVYTSQNFDAFLKKLQYPWSAVNEFTDTNVEPIKLPFSNSNIIFFLKANIYNRKQVQYELIRNRKIFSPWRNNDYDNSFVWIKDCPPGDYKVRIRYTAQPQHVTEHQFKVEPAWHQTNLFKIIAGLFIAAIIVTVLFVILFARQRKRTQQELAKKTKLQLELKAIYAQLNPHFIFNALGSIQGLINQQDIKGANSYLSDFARLMRESLQNNSKDNISLKEELRMLDTYLRLEQLRFGFGYHIIVDPEINSYETSIPALLLQPLVENAVKHGVSALQARGIITVAFKRTPDHMVITVTDNGNGFPTDKITGGFGLKLTKDRIKLLNDLKPNQFIEFALANVEPSGLQTTLTFNHWFL